MLQLCEASLRFQTFCQELWWVGDALAVAFLFAFQSVPIAGDLQLFYVDVYIDFSASWSEIEANTAKSSVFCMDIFHWMHCSFWDGMKVDESRPLPTYWFVLAPLCQTTKVGGSCAMCFDFGGFYFPRVSIGITSCISPFRLGCALFWVVWWRRKSSRKRGSALCWSVLPTMPQWEPETISMSHRRILLTSLLGRVRRYTPIEQWVHHVCCSDVEATAFLTLQPRWNPFSSSHNYGPAQHN